MTYTIYMKKKLSILAAIPIMALGCGTAPGTKSADEVRAFASKYTAGTTTESTVIEDALNSFGAWSKSGQTNNGLNEFITYQTSNGDVTLNFTMHCNDGTTSCIADGYLHNPSLATSIYSGVN